jgi:imidazolonepropionase-like amidohydrolase
MALAAGSPASTPGPFAQDDPVGQDEQPAAPEAAPEPTTVLIRAAKAVLAPGDERENVDILIRGERIAAIGEGLAAPEGAQVLEAPMVTAGLIDSWSVLSVDPGSVNDSRGNPSLSAVDGVDPYESTHLREDALAAGVTGLRVQAALNSRDGSQGAFLRNDLQMTLDGSVLSCSAGLGMVLPAGDPFQRVENVDRVFSLIDAGSSYRRSQLKYAEELAEWERMIAEKTEELEKDFKKAKKDRDKDVEEAEGEGEEYKEKKYKEDRKPRAPRYNADNEVFAKVSTGALPLFVEAHRAVEIRNLLAKKAEYPQVRLYLVGASDGHLFAEELSKAGVGVVLTPGRSGGAYDVSELELAATLDEEGVEVLFGTGGSPTLVPDLPLLVAAAIGHGLDRDAALHALTLGPARAFDLTGDLGSIAPGKVADLVLYSGDPFATTTRVQSVLLRGEVVLQQ